MKKTRKKREAVRTLASVSQSQKVRGGWVIEDHVIFGNDDSASSVVTDNLDGF